MNRSNGMLRHLTFAVGLSIFILSPQPLSAQFFRIEQIMDALFPSQLTAATQGSRIAWIFNHKGDENVWVADGPDFVPRQVTHYIGDNGLPINSLRLTPDGRSVIYARGTEIDGEGRAANALGKVQQPKQQVWIDKVDGGEPHLLGNMGCGFAGCEDIQVSPDGKWAIWAAEHELWIVSIGARKTDAKQLTDIRGNVSSPQWSPDSVHLVATVDRIDHTLTAILDVSDGVLEKIHYIAPSTDRDLSPQWSPDGAHIAFLRMGGVEQKRPIIPEHAVPWSIWVADTHTYAAAPIWRSGSGMRDSLPPFGPEQFLFAAEGRIVFCLEADGRNHLYSIAFTGGPTLLLTSGNYDVETASLNADKKSVLLTSNEDDVDRRHVWEVPVAGDKAPQALAKGETIEWSPVATADGKAIICLGSSATTPALVYRLSGGSRQLITKGAIPADFPSAQLVVPKQVTFQSAGGFTIHGQLFIPKGQAKPGPALIYIHGGPERQMLLGFHYMSPYHFDYAENQYLTSLGFTVLSVNYRLGIMYGRDFREPSNAGWRGASEYNDILAGARYLQALPTVDPKRIGLWGGSYGGLLTALGLARNSDIFSAGADLFGVHDWSDYLLPTKDMEEHLPGLEGATTAPDLNEAEKLAFSSSPDSSIDSWKSPVLLIQGDDDRSVPFSQMISLVQKLRKHGASLDEIVYPDEIHGLMLWKNHIKTYQAIAEYFQRHLGYN